MTEYFLFEPVELDSFLSDISLRVEEVALLFGFDIGPPEAEFASILEAAKTEMTNIAIQTHFEAEKANRQTKEREK